MNIKSFFTQEYLFNINRVMLQRTDKVFLALGILLFVLAIVFKLAERMAPNSVDKYFRNRLYRVFLTIGLSEMVWFAARYENVSFFGSHFVALLIGLIGLVWLVFVAKDFIKNYKTRLLEWEKQQQKLKYLPK